MPNLHVTDRQVMLYMTRSQQHGQESAAAMAGFSARTGRRIDKDPRLPSQKRQPRTWRTRTDPCKDGLIAGQRDQRGQMRAGGIADLADALGVDFEIAGRTAQELHRGAHIMHRRRIALLAWFAETVIDREDRIAGGGEVRSPMEIGVAAARLPAAAM